MFTGIVEAVGRLASLRTRGSGAELEVTAPFAAATVRGESVCVNGVCLTATWCGRDRIRADAVRRTLDTSTLGALAPGARVNLERAVAAGDRLGGHLVTGHVDGVATLVEMTREGAGMDAVFELPEDVVRFAAARGSIALDGVSLTVAAVAGRRITVSYIPETLRATVAGEYRPGSLVNVEADLVARYVEALRGEGAAAAPASDGEGRGVTLKRLRELGYVKERP